MKCFSLRARGQCIVFGISIIIIELGPRCLNRLWAPLHERFSASLNSLLSVPRFHDGAEASFSPKKQGGNGILFLSLGCKVITSRHFHIPLSRGVI